MNNSTESPFFIAEISANHLGSLDRALALVEAAANSGADAVKFQTYTADTMTLDIENFSVSGDHALWGGRRLYDLYKEAHTPWEWHPILFQRCRELDVIPFSSPFDATAVDFLETLDVPMYKIASLETGDHDLIRKVAETGKPLIISTGATFWDEIKELVNVVHDAGNQNLTLLVCTSSYPAKARDSHVRRLRTIQEEFGVKVGLSDHTLGIGASLAAIALGATTIEKHFTLNRLDGGADSAFSLEPEEFQKLVEEGEACFEALGSNLWTMQSSEMESRRLRRSLYVVKDVRAGDIANSENVRAIRPGEGALPKFLHSYLGREFLVDVPLGTPLTSEMLQLMPDHALGEK